MQGVFCGMVGRCFSLSSVFFCCGAGCWVRFYPLIVCVYEGGWLTFEINSFRLGFSSSSFMRGLCM